MKNTFLKKTAIITVGYLLMIGASAYFVLLPRYDKYQDHKKVNIEKQTTVDDNDSKINALQKIEKNNSEFTKLFQNVNNLWPDVLEVSDFIVEMEGLAKDTGILIDSFSVDEQKPAAATKTTTSAKSTEDEENTPAAKNNKSTNTGTKFTVTFKTSYATFLEVTSRMETLSRLNTLNSIKLNSTEEGLSVNLTGTIYYGK